MPAQYEKWLYAKVETNGKWYFNKFFSWAWGNRVHLNSIKNLGHISGGVRCSMTSLDCRFTMCPVYEWRWIKFHNLSVSKSIRLDYDIRYEAKGSSSSEKILMHKENERNDWKLFEVPNSTTRGRNYHKKYKPQGLKNFLDVLQFRITDQYDNNFLFIIFWNMS